MDGTITAAVWMPFFGTALGASAVLFVRDRFPERLRRLCGGFAAGVMTAASVWSLLLPAIGQAESGGTAAFTAVPGGFLAGVIGMILTERAVAALYRRKNDQNKPLSGTAFMILAVTLHNVPEGLAVGIACAGLTGKAPALSPAGVTALSLGIALQNIPEGAIISMPLRAEGKSRGRALLGGALSGAVEPIAAGIALLAAAPILRLMPFFLSFAAGAMLYVTVQELIPEAVTENSRLGSAAFSMGFVLMMTMDVML